jgi:hypothetical protein
MQFFVKARIEEADHAIGLGLGECLSSLEEGHGIDARSTPVKDSGHRLSAHRKFP